MNIAQNLAGMTKPEIRCHDEHAAGHDDEYLASQRSDPVVVPLNVHVLMAEDAWARTKCSDTPYDTEVDEIFQRHEDTSDAEYNPAAEDAEVQAVRAAWTVRYVAYAEAFTAAVIAEAAQIEGLAAPVTVGAVTDPVDWETGALHPDEYDDPDPLVFRLWDTARRATALPGREAGPQ